MNEPHRPNQDPVVLDQTTVVPTSVIGSPDGQKMLSELAKTFQESIQKIIAEIKDSLGEGRIGDAVKAINELKVTANEYTATTLEDLCLQAERLAENEKWTELLKEWMPKLETATQAAVSFLRDRDLLEGEVSLPVPVHHTEHPQ